MHEPQAFNPYAAPTNFEPADVVNERSINWILWLLSAVVFEAGLTAACLYKDLNGQICALLSGTGLAIAIAVAARRYSRWPTMLLAQCLNLCVWGSMLITVWLILPSVNGLGLSRDDVDIFVMIWLGGALSVSLLALAFGISRRTKSAQQVGPIPGRDIDD